jgi:hypothetical protein
MVTVDRSITFANQQFRDGALSRGYVSPVDLQGSQPVMKAKRHTLDQRVSTETTARLIKIRRRL